MKVSVALCTYNGCSYVRAQLESILGQTRLPDEIVVIDDCSRDATLSIVEAMTPYFIERGVSMLVSCNASNIGYVKNFEKAVTSCSGTIIFLCDQDDVWAEDKIASMLACFEKHRDVMLVYSDATVVDANLLPMGFTQSEALHVQSREREMVRQGKGFDALLVRNLVTGATAAFRKELLAYALPFPELWIHDEWLALTAAAVGYVHFCDNTLIRYRQHGANQIGVRRRYLIEKIRSAFQPRGTFYTLQLERTKTLKRHLLKFGELVPPEKMAKIDDRLLHFEFRSQLPAAKTRRILPVVGEWRSGRYHQYSNGLRAIVRDLLEPL